MHGTDPSVAADARRAPIRLSAQLQSEVTDQHVVDLMHGAASENARVLGRSNRPIKHVGVRVSRPRRRIVRPFSRVQSGQSPGRNFGSTVPSDRYGRAVTARVIRFLAGCH